MSTAPLSRSDKNRLTQYDDVEDVDDGTYRLERTDASTWQLVERSILRDDAHSVVARIEEVDESGVVVSWLRPIPLPTRYMSADMVLIDLDLWHRRRNAAERPIPIPHMPPTGPQKAIVRTDDPRSQRVRKLGPDRTD